MVKIIDGTPQHIPHIISIAEETWWPTYSSIVSTEQLRFMLNAIYSHESLLALFESKSQQFILLEEDGIYQGFAAYGPRPEMPQIFKLHKLYVLPKTHGKGFGRLLIQDVVKRIHGATALDLNVNRFNPAKTFYERMNFKVIGEEDVPIGPYFMNDYVMRLELQKSAQHSGQQILNAS